MRNLTPSAMKSGLFKMATQRKPKFSCDTCHMDFMYRCKYARHLKCAAHQRFSESLNISDDEEEVELRYRSKLDGILIVAWT